MDYSKIERDVEEYVRNSYVFSDRHFPYHNLDHTVDVVHFTEEICGYYLLSAPERFIVKVSAWFHDIGHLNGDMTGHEERGAAIMRTCLTPLPVPERLVTAIAGCIMATKYPWDPHTLYEEILCDADTFHFGTSKFKETDTAVKREVELRTGKIYPDWHKKSIKLLEEHRFFTKYCQDLLDSGKQENIRWLKSL
ncbi:HD domain-containing protein [Flavitalea sp. BT771]|uniref:HD domain-containing protein n=1 Tax=Flavitalea sp. BT771 TaxID=3063329 RepID=UPI0026E1D8A7|nr:HD domain-containing protein [Flavitalea sp. BT771]MDO6432517.1 HD domain-containing protein [Flavitalea sp. BT771]MDV6221426.1 HD domain-containing protein [Flavitalea sp. BT771]